MTDFERTMVDRYFEDALDLLYIVFSHKQLASIDETLKKLDGIAFRAQERYKTEPFYKYLDKRKK